MFLEITAIPREPAQENADIIVAFLSEFPLDMFDTDGGKVMAYGLSSGFSAADFDAINEMLEAFITEPIATREIPKENWNELWESNYFEPVTISEAIRLRAAFQEPDNNVKWDLVIQPKMSFGTGHHSTTQLVLELMLDSRELFANASVLDMGAGTGVLAIMAEKFGAANILAVDIEDWAAKNIEENAALNNCSHIQAAHGDSAFLSAYSATFDVVLANIHKSVLMQDAVHYAQTMRSNSNIFLSGFYENDLSDIRRHYETLGFDYREHRVLNDWCAMRMAYNATKSGL